MRRIVNNTTTHVIAFLAAFVMLTGFSLAGDESFPITLSSPEAEDVLSELAYHFPDQAVEPVILDKADDSGFSISRFANHRFFDLFLHAGSGSASRFSRFQSHPTEFFFDNKSTILLKLRI